jgi:hypothetical protein
MRIVRSLLVGAAILAFIPATAAAQERRFHFNVGGGPTFIAGDLGDRFSTGLGPAVGFTWDFTDMFGVQFEYAFRRFHAENYVDIFGGAFTGYHDTHQLAGNIVYNINGRGARIRVYALAGVGAYYRNATITEYLGSGIVCDPWWYICGTYPVTGVVAQKGGWDFGFNIGGGVGFKMGEDAEFFVESRYHFVAGPDIQVPAGIPPAPGGTPGKADGHYIPLTFGFRF